MSQPGEVADIWREHALGEREKNIFENVELVREATAEESSVVQIEVVFTVG